MRILISTIVVLLYTIASASMSEVPPSQKKKKDITDYNDVDLERLYMEWEKNDGEKVDDDDEDDNMSTNRRPLTPLNLQEHQGSPEDLLKMTKKGQTLLMFVSIRDPSAPTKKCRMFTEKYTELWRSMLRNNHVVSETAIIDDDRSIFMFPDGSQAFEAKDFLLKQAQVSEVVLEGQQYAGAGTTMKQEL